MNEPLFSYFIKCKDVAFRVLQGNYVSKDSTTGIAHQAPYFGEDEYHVGLANRVIKNDQEIICPVDPSGKFSSEGTDFHENYLKDAENCSFFPSQGM